jgi:hypothetical protein
VFKVFIDAMQLTVISRSAVRCAACAIWIGCGAGDIHGEIMSDFEVRKHRLSESHTLVRDVNEFLSRLPTNNCRFVSKSVYEICPLGS